MVTIAESQFALPATAPALSLIKEAKAHPGSIIGLARQGNPGL